MVDTLFASCVKLNKRRKEYERKTLEYSMRKIETTLKCTWKPSELRRRRI